MKKNSLRIIIIFLFFIFLQSCAKKVATVSIVEERTALEKQILGEFTTISKDVYLLASVRAIDEEGKLKKTEEIPEEKKKVIRALQRMAFNADDIKYYKKLGIIGENNNGKIEIFSEKIKELEEKKQIYLKELVKEENEDREILFKRILETNINLKAEDMKKVAEIYGSMKRDLAEKGEFIQLPDGKWIQK
ncbi:MAG TPA: DUF1318 domain-containing protein [bacterium]|nr:DUF1318 domain-containing protein [bacterium]HOL47568.1 DUF1318 domain-containing protein [bacterium]HPQ18830.1 DUF1318 domain-containing protein [bacterium]